MNQGGVKMKLERSHRRSIRWLSGVAAGCLVASAAVAQANDGAAGRKTSPYRAAAKLTPKAQTYYVAAWGVDKLRVSYTSSGNLIRFTYRVTDPRRAKALSAKASPP